MIFLTNLTRSWLKHLEEGTTKGCYDLEKKFISHFEGAYTKLGSTWQLAGCQCEKNETQRDYIKCFTRSKNEFHHVPENNVVHAFMGGVKSEEIIQEIRSEGITSAKKNV